MSGSRSLICPLQTDDIEFACSLVELAGWNQRAEDWSRLLAAEPEGCFLIEWNGSPAGTATTTRYGSDLGWVGMVLVHPDFRRRGLATALLERCLVYLLEENQMSCVKLDATPEGQKVYEKLGFHAELELTRWEGTEIFGEPPLESGQSVIIPKDLDHIAFGADRLEYLERLRSDSDRAAIGPEGFGLSRQGRVARYLGPVVAEFPDTGRSLVQALLTSPSPGPVYWDIPEENTGAKELAGELGFQRQRPLIRMWTGKAQATGQANLQWAIGAPETG
ncbi:MAG: GNAT family N-acetyltransferase [Verrucomicrobiales bacterium]|nr:GNAT family N-acetyltransferase [Verrucomicrobiales bacterium]